jgi:hypothetical protein
MKYEISDEQFYILRGACLVAYKVLSQETNGVVDAPMQEIRDTFNALEKQRDEPQDDEPQP